MFLIALLVSCSTQKKVVNTIKPSYVYHKNRQEAASSGNFLASKRGVQKKFFISKRKDKFFCEKLSNRRPSDVK